jgi:hypothetical protein
LITNIRVPSLEKILRNFSGKITITIFQSINHIFTTYFYIFTIIPYSTEMAAQTSGDFGGFNIFANPAPHLRLLFRKKSRPLPIAILLTNNGGEKRGKNSIILAGGGGGPIDHIVLILADEKDDLLPFT